MNEAPRARLVAYSLAVLGPGVSLLLRWPLWPVLEDRLPHMTFLPAVALAAYYGGLRPGLLATLLSALAADYFLLTWHTSLDVSFAHIGTGFCLFVLTGVILSGLSESLHRARHRILIDERLRAEEARRETEDRFRQLAENINEIFWMTDARHERVLYISPGYEEVWGRTCQSLYEQPQSWVENIHPDDRGSVIESIEQRRQGVFNDGVFRVVRPDGSIRWIRSRAFPIKDPAGQISRIAGLAEDITERKRGEEALRENEQRWRNLTEALPQFVWTAGADGTADYFSTQIVEYTGLPEKELLAWGWMDVLHPDDREQTRKSWIDAIAKERNHEVEHRIRRADGTYRWFTTRGVPIRDTAGHIVKWFGTCTDITEHMRSEQALREGEQRWRSITEALPQLVWTAMPDGHVDYQSTQFDKYFGIPAEQMLGWKWLEVIHPDDQERTQQAWQAAIQTECDYDLEHRFRRFDGVYRWFKTRGVRIRDSEGNITKWFGTCTDITDSKQAEEALRESEHRWRSLTEALPQLVWTATTDGTCDYFSTQWTQHTGIPEGQLLGWQWMETLHPDDREPTRLHWTNSVAGRGPYDVEYRVRRTDGEYRWFKTRGVPIRDGDGRIYKWFGTCTDITDLREVERALRASEQRFRSLVQNSSDIISVFDAEGTVLYQAPSVERLLGWRTQDRIGRNVFRDPIVHPDDMDRKRGFFEAIRSQSVAPVTAEFRLRHADGSWRDIEAVGQNFLHDPSVSGIVTNYRDITERKRAGEELWRAKEVAEAANRAKDEFLANVSHEIRTPMNAILGMTDLALDTPLTEDQRQSLNTVKSSADNLLGIINDLLDFSKIEAGKLALDPAEFSPRTVIGDTLQALAMRAHRKGLEVICDIQQDVPDSLVGDAGRLRQVLLNLVGNAIKFTEQGEVVVRVETTDGPRDGDWLLFSVTDTGIGIAADKLETIFRAFEQEDTSTSRKYGGTGLGLTISSRLVTLMAGVIGVDSQPGRGSTFTFKACFARPADVSASASAKPPKLLDNLPVLIVDDNATNRYILEEWLRAWRMEPLAVGDGATAMDALLLGAASEKQYPLVMLDARMPDTDGLALAAKIRERTELSTTRMILLTSGDQPGDAERSRQLGINARLLKPIRQEELLDTIYRVMSRSDGESTAVIEPATVQQPTRAPEQSATPLRILVAEDNEFNSQLLEQLLVRRGYRVRVANNGRDALSLAEKGAFDLLLLDVHMPELDGFQVIQAIRERERSTAEHLPVIALTARSRKEDRAKCLAAGMDDFLAKPIQAVTLWDTIDRVVISNQEAVSKSPIPGTNVELLDARVLMAACGGDGQILRKLCQTFQACLPEHLKSIQDALRERDARRVREAAHKSCGMIAAFSSVAGAVASNLEDLAADGQLEEARPLVEQLETMTREMIRLVGELSLETLQHQAEVDDQRDQNPD
jgi:two-component system sensor histidine kinase/response regulator